MTEQEKMLVKQDLALCLKFDAKLGDYQNLNAVQKLYNWAGMEQRFRTVIGKKYAKRLGEVLAGETEFVDCVLCGGFMMDGTAICADCLQKYRSLLPKPEKQKGQMEGDASQKMAAFSRQAANTAKRMGATAKDNLHTVSEKISTFAGENETVSAAKDKLKGMADNGREKLQENPTAAKVMEQGKAQAKKARGKWNGLSKKKKIIVTVVCVLIVLGAISEYSSSGSVGGDNVLDYLGADEKDVYKVYDKNDFYSYDILMINDKNNRSGLPHITLAEGKVNACTLESGMNTSLHVGGLHIGDNVSKIESCVKKLKAGDNTLLGEQLASDGNSYGGYSYSCKYKGKDVLITISSQNGIITMISLILR